MAIVRNPKTYVVAVSGGVDSAVLLHMVASKNPKLLTAIQHPPSVDYRLVVAHFDHGIRPDSARDRQFVQALAKHYKLDFVYEEGNLGPTASEESARKARYKFLAKVMNDYQAIAILTAHHQDDVIETAIINLIRGTNRKGLGSIGQTPRIKRPLIDLTKAEIKLYAKSHKLHWRDDPSNSDTKYFRNYIRLQVIPTMEKRDPTWRQKLLTRIIDTRKINHDIHLEMEALYQSLVLKTEQTLTINRHKLIMLPNNIAKELLIMSVLELDKNTKLSSNLVDKMVVFSKTASHNKRFVLSKSHELQIRGANIILK